jgi:hypothetical protein
MVGNGFLNSRYSPTNYSLYFHCGCGMNPPVTQPMPLKKVIFQAAFFSGPRALFLGLATLLLAALPVRADLRFDAFLGYDDILPERSWFPVTCEIYNDGPPFNAVVEVTAQDFGQSQTRRLVLDLPTNTRKRISIPVFATARSWTVRLLDERGKVRGEQTLQPRRVMQNNLPLIAALARTVGGMPVLPQSPASAYNGDDSKYIVARLQTSLFPDNPLVLEGIDVLYLSSEKAADLSVGQVNALMAWLQRGGHLIVGIEQLTDVNGTPWLRDLLPCTLTTIVNVSAHDSLQDFARTAAMVAAPDNGLQNRPRVLQRRPGMPAPPPMSSAPPASLAESPTDDVQFDAAPIAVAVGSLRDGTVLLGDASAPLAVEGRRGRGKITVLTFSPEREPFISWKNRAWFWSKLAEVRANAFLNPMVNGLANRLSSDGIFRSMIETKQVRKLPLGWLLALLVAYLVVIGPLDQYWLKKINRQMLTWVTFPCYVVFFSALIYFIGFHLRAGELEWNELNMVDILPDGSDRAVLRGQTYISIYSPNNAHYQLKGDQKFGSLRGQLGNFGGSQEGSRATVDQIGNNFQADAYVAVWTSELFVSDWVEPSALPLGMTVSRSGDGWDVTVNNGLDRPMPGLRVVLNEHIYTLGDVAAGQTKTFTVKVGQGLTITEMVGPDANNFRQAVQNLNNSFGNNVNLIPNVPEAADAACFLSYINDLGGQGMYNNNNNTFTAPSNLDLSRFARDRAGQYAILLAWDAGHSPTALNQFTPKRSHRDTLFRLVVPVKM